MENASKALIIAGAILVSILLIGIGVALISALNAPQEEAMTSITGAAMTMFNQKFEKYAGSSKKGTDIRTLLTDVITNNSATQSGRKVTITTTNKIGSVAAITTATDVTATISNLRNNITGSKFYTVALTYGTTGANLGYITSIAITEN